MREPAYIFSSGTLKRKDNTLIFEMEEGKRYLPVEETGDIFIFGEVNINKRLLEFLSQKGIMLLFFNRNGYYIGSFSPKDFLGTGEILLGQAEHYLDQEKRLFLAKSFVEGAIKNMLKILKYYQRRGKNLETEINEIDSLRIKANRTNTIGRLMQIEGTAKKLYYRSFNKIIEAEGFKFLKRTKRPPLDRINALISFSNQIIYSYVLSEIYRTRLDPRIGFLHATNQRKFSLNLDIAEIFKPIIGDRTIFSVLNKGIIKDKDFITGDTGVFLKPRAKRKFVEKLDERLKQTITLKNEENSISYRRLIRKELLKLEKHIKGEKTYKPFVMEW